MSDDPFDLERFVTAQEGTWPTPLEELRAGRKRSHWMWFVFPQLIGLGSSPTARHFALRSLEEARAYLAHPVLGPRLLAAVEAVMAGPAPSLAVLFGAPDDLKFSSSMTLFALAAAPGNAFADALTRWSAGRPDARTLSLLGRDAGSGPGVPSA